MMTTTQMLQALIPRLTAKGVAPAYFPALMRAVLQVVVKGGLFTVPLVNGQLQQQGWGSEVLDETSFQLIANILETELGYRVRHYHL
jgi:hypothetical protein